MKKTFLILSFFIILTGCSCQKNELPKSDLDIAKEQAEIYKNYQINQQEHSRILKGQEFIYYLAADNKRYVFPTDLVFQSWYGNYDPDQLEEKTLEQLYDTEIGGNVFFRPGTIMQTPTDFNYYLVVNNGVIKDIEKDLLKNIYGSNWQDLIKEIPNYYFTQYRHRGTIESAADYPSLDPEITIDKDKGLQQ